MIEKVRFMLFTAMLGVSALPVHQETGSTTTSSASSIVSQKPHPAFLGGSSTTNSRSHRRRRRRRKKATLHFASVNTAASLKDLDSYITKEMKKAHMASASIAVVHNSKVLYKKAFGKANPSKAQRATVDTPYSLASISKIVAATSLMKLYDRGLFKLDEDINIYLKKYPKAKFQVKNPFFPKEPISFRMLLTHTSSIVDGKEHLPESLHYTKGHDAHTTLHDFLDTAFAERKPVYSKHKPGSHWKYSNLGFTLVGYMVEVLTGHDFAAWSTENVLKPLGFHVPSQTSWHLDSMKQRSVALPVGWNKKKKKLFAYCQYTSPDYPNGGLRATAADSALLLSAIMQFGKTKSGRFLKKSTVAEMRKKSPIPTNYVEMHMSGSQRQSQGLGIEYEEISGREVLGHEGGEMGVATSAFFNPKTNVGVVLLASANWEQTHQFDKIFYGMLGKLFDTFETRLFHSKKIKVNPKIYKGGTTINAYKLDVVRGRTCNWKKRRR